MKVKFESWDVLFMKVIILGGFLGSGKTTALMRMARYIVDTTVSEKKNKLVILENEVGKVSIDDAFLRGGDFTVNNLFAGCVCCSLAGELISAVARIHKEYDPDWLIIEPTGIAMPISIQNHLFNLLNLSSRIVVLADASRWKRLHIPMSNMLDGQISDADAVLINKIDLADEETLDGIERDISAIEPNAKIFRISALNDVPVAVWAGAAGIEKEELK
jgi:G3E family GTPase